MLIGANRAGVDVEPSYNGWAVLPPVTAANEGRNTVLAYAAVDRIGNGTKRALR